MGWEKKKEKKRKDSSIIPRYDNKFSCSKYTTYDRSRFSVQNKLSKATINAETRNNYLYTRQNSDAAVPAIYSSDMRGYSRPAFLMAASVPGGGRPDFNSSKADR